MNGILSTVTETIIKNRAHPTTVLNALINLENEGGAAAVHELEYTLARMVRQSFQDHNSNYRIVKGWLDATRAYLETHCPKKTIQLRGVN
jgi:hypothetical protein